MVRKRVVVHGRVQGVFFRDTLRRQAEAHGVSGWARNRSDGALEAALEGDSDAVDAVLSFAGQGPRGASVERVDVSDEDPQGLGGFSIR